MGSGLSIIFAIYNLTIIDQNIPIFFYILPLASNTIRQRLIKVVRNEGLGL